MKASTMTTWFVWIAAGWKNFLMLKLKNASTTLPTPKDLKYPTMH
jgi:hypothetical protein